MKSRTSFINKGILRNDLKSMGWMGVVYLLGLLACFPLQIFMIHSREAERTLYISGNYIMNNPYARLFQMDSSPFMGFLLIIMPVLAGMMLFRYLHYNQPVDLMHSLPVKRTTLFNTHLAAGILLLFIPVLVTALISGLALNGLGIEYVPNAIFFNWLWISLVTNLFFFILTATIGMVCGMSWVQGALSYVVLILPTGFLTLFYYNMDTYIYGFADGLYSSNLEKLSPLLRMFDYSHRIFTGSDIAIYLLCTIILYMLGWYLYNKRQLEMAGNALAFTFLFPIFKYGVAFCGMLFLGCYFNSTQNGNIYWTWFGYLLGSLLGYWLSEILIYKTLHVFDRIAVRGYLVFGLVMAVLIGGINLDITGYEKKLPELAQVETVYWDNSFNALTRDDNRNQRLADYVEPFNDTYNREVSMFYSQPGTIKDIYELHKAIITNGPEEKRQTYDKNDPYQNLCFAYKLKNGDMLYREYNVSCKRYAAQLKPIYESEEHKLKVNDVLHISPQQIDVITINADQMNRCVKITDPEQIKDALTILQKDVRNQTYEDITSRKVPWGHISILLNNEKRLQLEWCKSYAEFDAWLQNTGQTARVMPADVQYVMIAKRPANASEMEKYRTKNPEEYLAGIEAQGDYIKITDSEQIDVCLRNYIYPDYGYAVYNVVFVLKNGDTFPGGFDEENKPEFVS